MSVKYQIEVPAMSVAKGVNNKTHDLSIEPKYNRKVILTLQNAVTGDKKKPYLHFSKDIKKRKSVVIDFKGGDSSVYSEIAPHFSVKF